MKRREFIGLVGGAAAWPVMARAQRSGRLPVVGSLWSAADAETAAARRLPLLRGLAELGYDDQAITALFKGGVVAGERRADSAGWGGQPVIAAERI